MADSALQIDFILAGYRHPNTDEVLSGGKIKTYLDGTSTLSSLWTDKDKGGTATNPIILDSDGKAEVFGDNIYKFEIYDSDDVLIETLNGLTYRPKTIVTKSLSSDYGCDLSVAVDAIGSTRATLTVDCDTIIASGTTVTIPATLQLDVIQGGSIDGVAGGGTETLAFSGVDPSAGTYQIFGINVTVTGLITAYPEWWGIDGTSDEVEIQSALDAAQGGAVILSHEGYTFTAAGITMSVADTYLGCPEARRCIITTAADINAVTISARITIENVMLDQTGSSTKAGYLWLDGGKNCEILTPWVQNFFYNYHFNSSIGTGITYNEIRHPYSVSNVAGGSEIFMEQAGLGNVNENHFFGGNFHASNGSLSSTLSGNNNKFVGTSFENSTSDADIFAIEEGGSNIIDGCRFEASCNGVRVANSSANQTRMSRIVNNFMDINDVEVVITSGRVKTDMYSGQSTFNGYLTAGSTGSSTVDVQASSGQAVVQIASTTGFNIGTTVVIDEGNASEEWGIVSSVTAGVSITLSHNLTNTHNVAVAVETKGRAHGVLGRPVGDAFRTQIWAYGYPVIDLSGEIVAKPGIDLLGGKLLAIGGVVTKNIDTNTSNPPTEAQLISALGSASSNEDGFIAVLDDSGSGTNVYLVISNGTNWYHTLLTKAL